MRQPADPPPRVESFAEVLDLVRASAAGTGACRRVIGVAGAPGAGKTTLVEAVVRVLGRAIAHVPMDGFHLADVELARLGRLERKGAPDTFDVDGYAALLERIHAAAGTGETVYAPAFDRDIEQPVAGSIAVLPSCELVLTEGNYLLLDDAGWRRVRASLDELVR